MHRLIGRGGVGLVYLAENNETGEEVVLKLLSPDWSRKPEAVRRFEREAERLGSVKHPNIVRLLDQGYDAGRAYLVMEHLDGELLSDYIGQQHALDLHTFVPIAAQVLKGIGHAHSRGVMLRDIKPANIMLCRRKGRTNFVKILDFGLAKLIRDEQPVTEEHVLGTAGYLAPEVIEGNDDLDLRVDVFSLGALFYFMLSGRLPFEGSESATVFYKTIHDDPTPLHEVLPTDHALPEGLIHLVHRCLSKDRTQRPDDANEVVEHLIDVVPASLFRLPRIREVPESSTVSSTVSEPGVPRLRRPETGETKMAGYGNTGMVQLVGQGAVSGSHPIVGMPDPPALREDPSETGRETVTVGHDPHAHETGGEDELAPQPAPTSGTGRIVVMIAAAVLLIGGGVALAGGGSGAEATQAQGAVVASAAPGRPGAAIAAHPSDGPSDAAVLRDEVTPGDPKGESSTAASDSATPAADHDETALAPVDIGSRPLANLFIDGKASGTTPFVGKLATGAHTIRMTARGYVSWEGTLQVRASGTEDLRVRLLPKGSKAGPRPNPPEPRPAPETTQPAADASKAEPAPPKPDKKSVFLPTKDPTKDPAGKQGGVFLPTKD